MDNPDTPETTDVADTAARRVKVYKLVDDKWADCGTGFCVGKIQHDKTAHFIVTSEENGDDNGKDNDNNNNAGDAGSDEEGSDGKKALLDTLIHGTTQYQRQQDTLVVWTSDDGLDYALSFQEVDGCLEICEFLKNVQSSGIAREISVVAIVQTGDGEVTEVLAGQVPELPVPCVENLKDVLEMLMITKFRNQFVNEIINDNGKWMSVLFDVFNECEQENKVNTLYLLNDIVRTLIYFNEVAIFEMLIGEEFIVDFIGVLEFDPDFQGAKMEWRKIMEEKFVVKYVFEIVDAEIKEEIRKSIVLKFLKDVVLARLIDDSVFNCFSSMIQQKDTVILEYFVENDVYIRELFDKYDTDTDDDRADANVNWNSSTPDDGIRMINQFVMISKALSFYKRDMFYKSMIQNGLMKMIKYSMQDIKQSIEIKILVTEVIVAIIEHDINLFKSESYETLLNLLINILIKDSNIGLKSQAFEAIKLLIDPNNVVENMDDVISISATTVNESFFNNFYDINAAILFSPIMKVDGSSKYDKSHLITLENLTEILNFISKFHDTMYSRSFILENRLLDGLNTIINNANIPLPLKLSSIRCLRNIIAIDDQFYTRYIITNNLLDGIVNLYKEHMKKENLVTASCLCLFKMVADIDAGVNVRLVRQYLLAQHSETLLQSPIAFPPNEDNSDEEDQDLTADDPETVTETVTLSVTETVPVETKLLPTKREQENEPEKKEKKEKQTEMEMEMEMENGRGSAKKPRVT